MDVLLRRHDVPANATQEMTLGSYLAVSNAPVNAEKQAKESVIPLLRQVQLLTVLHPHHLNVWLRNLTFKNRLLLLCDLYVLDFLGEFNHTS